MSVQKQLEQRQEQITAKAAKLNEIFEKAGGDVDFSKPEVLKSAGANSSAEVVEKVRSMNAELDALGKDRDRLANEAKAEKTPANAPALPGTPEEKRTKSFGELIMASEAVKRFRETKSAAASVVSGFGLPELKTLMTTAAGWAPESTRIGLVVDAVTRPIQLLDFIPTGTTNQAAVVYMAESTRTHAAAERAEGAAYAESEFALTETSETVRSIGDSITVTDEQLEDVAMVESYLNQRLMFGVRQRLDAQILTGNGTAPNLSGIQDRSGIQTQAKGSDPTPDAIYKAMTKVRVTGRAFPNIVVMHPNDWQDIRLLRTADGVYVWGNPSESGVERIWGVRVVQSDAETENTALVGDVNYCQLFERKGIEVAVGYVNTQFSEGERTIRAGMRAAFAVYRDAAFCTVTGI